MSVLPAPGGMNSWWTALAPGGAMDDMKIVAALPRVDTGNWPQAVAVAVMDLDMAETGRLLVAAKSRQRPNGTLRGESGEMQLIDCDPKTDLCGGAIIGYLPASIRS